MSRASFKSAVPGRRGKRTAISSGAATVAVAAADAAKRYRLLRFALSSDTAGADIHFQSDTTDITGVYNIPVNDMRAYTFVGGENATLGDALNIVITGGTITGDVWYEEIQ